MNKALLFYGALLGILLVSVSQVTLADDNPLKDAGFELQLSPDEGGWILFEHSMFSSGQAHQGQKSIFNWGYSRTVPFPAVLFGNASGTYQEFPAEPGSRWRLTGYGMTPTRLEGTPAFGIVQVSFFDARGNDLGTVETAGNTTTRAKTSNEVNSQSPVGEWIILDTGVATAPEDTATVQAFTLYVDYSGSGISQGVYFDDLALCALERGDDTSDCR